MEAFRIRKPQAEWKILRRTKRTQAAIMCIPPGESEGSATNKHDNSDQWLYVLSGKGRARIGRKTVPLAKGTLLLIEAKEKHQIFAGKTTLVTLNFYGPPVNFSESSE